MNVKLLAQIKRSGVGKVGWTWVLTSLCAAPLSAFSVCLLHYVRTAEGMEVYYQDDASSLFRDVFKVHFPLFCALLATFFIFFCIKAGLSGVPPAFPYRFRWPSI